jgi:hypothetical protein
VFPIREAGISQPCFLLPKHLVIGPRTIEDTMKIRLILHTVDKALVLFEGPPPECPPIPRPGDEIVREDGRVRVEGVSHQFQPDLLQISLLA